MNAVIFDLDNTLTHRGQTTRKYADVFCDEFQEQFKKHVDSAWLADHLIEMDENGYAGHDKRSLKIRALEIWRNKPSLEKLKDHWQAWFPNNPAPMPGLYESLEIIKEQGFNLGIITNGSVKAQTAKIHALNIGIFFECITISEQCGIKKPDQEIFHITLSKMRVHNKNACFIGDHPILDYWGAMEAGLEPIWLSGFHKWPEELEPPKNIAENLLSVTDLIIQLNNRK